MRCNRTRPYLLLLSLLPAASLTCLTLYFIRRLLILCLWRHHPYLSGIILIKAHDDGHNLVEKDLFNKKHTHFFLTLKKSDFRKNENNEWNMKTMDSTVGLYESDFSLFGELWQSRVSESSIGRTAQTGGMTGTGNRKPHQQSTLNIHTVLQYCINTHLTTSAPASHVTNVSKLL